MAFLSSKNNLLAAFTSRILGQSARTFSDVVKKSEEETSVLTKNPSWLPKDTEVVTHTGQKFDANDKFLVRFVGKQKTVNPRWAIDLIAEAPPIACKERVVSCDGGDGPLGHPKIFINLDQPGNHSCGYCGLRFYKEDHGH